MTITFSPSPPRHRGELEVYKQLLGFDDNSLYFWSSLDFIPGVNDVDLLVWHEKQGVYVIEIKAISLDMLLKFGFHSCEIEGRGEDRSPQNQAYDAMQSLRNYLSPKLNKTPYMVATVLWPYIARSEWKLRFRNSKEISDLSNSMIMKEDLYSGAQSFEKKLREIWVKPPVRKGSDYPFKHDPTTFRSFCDFLNPSASPTPAVSDYSKLKILEKGIKRDLVRNFPPYKSQRVVFTGAPGTGKTFRLLQIGIMHARENAKVLFCCFNQVLASDINRILNLLDISFKAAGDKTLFKELINVMDISSLAGRLCSDLSIDIPKNDFELWGQLIIDELKNTQLLTHYPKYDTILIDECQDFMDWQLMIPIAIATNNCQIILGKGSGQEIYSDTTQNHENLTSILGADVKTFNLSRNFRNVKPVYELAHLFYECEINSNRIGSVFDKRFKNRTNKTQEIEFDILGSQLPTLSYILDDVDYEDPDYRRILTELVVRQYEDLISAELAKFGNESSPSDLLILVPEIDGDEVKWARSALSNIEKKMGVGFIDYVIQENRKKIAPKDKIRLVTYHSCRGLEGVSVLVFGIEKISMFDKVSKKISPKLGYIALSRAIFNLSICVRASKRNSITEFIENSIAYIKDNHQSS